MISSFTSTPRLNFSRKCKYYSYAASDMKKAINLTLYWLRLPELREFDQPFQHLSPVVFHLLASPENSRQAGINTFRDKRSFVLRESA